MDLRPLSLKGARKYFGVVAASYDAKRENQEKRAHEREIIEAMLADLKPGTKVLDVPVGTGWMIPYCQSRGFEVVGIDRSPDMLREAAEKWIVPIRLLKVDIRSIPYLDKTFDVALMVRVTRWLSREDCRKAIREVARVTRQRIIFSTRIVHRRYPALSRPLDLFALDGWTIVRREEADGADYVIVEMRPT